MKIGVVTLPLQTNYGGILQAYALQRVLQDMGHDAVLLDSYPQCPRMKPFPLQQLAYLKRLLRKMISPRAAVTIFYEHDQITSFPKKEHVRQFYREHVRHVPFGKGVPLHSADFDALIVGSDQVWRSIYGRANLYDRFLSFTESWTQVKRIAYAASFGTDEWEYTEKQTIKCRRLAQLFDAISVREESGISLCREHFGVDATWVLDPTMLVDPRHYMEHIEKAVTNYPSSMCFGYILDSSEEKDAILSNIATSLKLHQPSFQNVDDPDNSAVPTVEAWLKAFHEAEFVFTDSFHGCVFSILFNRPFVVYGNKKRGMARFHSLLAQFGLEDRLVTTPDEAVQVSSQPINWNRVNVRLNKLRANSLDFISDALNRRDDIIK